TTSPSSAARWCASSPARRTSLTNRPTPRCPRRLRPGRSRSSSSGRSPAVSAVETLFDPDLHEEHVVARLQALPIQAHLALFAGGRVARGGDRGDELFVRLALLVDGAGVEDRGALERLCLAELEFPAGGGGGQLGVVGDDDADLYLERFVR